jgi:hypothetical protein
MQAGHDSDGGVGGCKEMCTLHVVIVLCCVRGGGGGGEGGEFLALYLGILWMSLRLESFHAYPRLIRWDFSTVY